MRPLRIAVQAWLDWRKPSGARTRLRGLLAALADLPESSEHEIHLLGSHDGDPVLQGLCTSHEHLHWHTIFPKGKGSFSRTLNESKLLAASLQRLGADLLDIATLPLPGVPVPTCLTIHDLRDLGTHARGMRRFAIHQTLEQAVQSASRIVVPSSAVARELSLRHPRSRDRVLVVPPALDPKPFRSAPPWAGLPTPYFLHLGRPEPRKNLPFLIRVHQRALAADPDLPTLVLAGPGLVRDRLPPTLLQALANGDRRIHLLDDPTDADLPSLLAGATALLFPSELEGFGMPALEALAAGIPMLVSRGSAQADVAGSAGLDLPLDQPEAWVRAMTALRRSPALHARLSEEARMRSRHFSPERAARALLDAWLEACA